MLEKLCEMLGIRHENKPALILKVPMKCEKEVSANILKFISVENAINDFGARIDRLEDEFISLKNLYSTKRTEGQIIMKLIELEDKLKRWAVNFETQLQRVKKDGKGKTISVQKRGSDKEVQNGKVPSGAGLQGQ